MAVAGTRALAGEGVRAGYPAATRSFTWTYALLGALFILGVAVDLWAHNNVRPLFETFLTPWHGLLYGGFAVMAAYIALIAARHRARGFPWERALPRGYGLGLVGAAVFSFGGVFDLVWHSLFGIEADLDALVSPSHLVLLLGATLMVSGPLRAAIAGNNPWRWSTVLATVATLTVALPFFGFFVGPFSIRTAMGPIGPRNAMQAMEVLGTLIYSGVVVGLFLFVLRSTELPVGSGLAVVGGNAIAMAIIRTLDLGSAREIYFAVAIVAGVVTDALLRTLRPSAGRPAALRRFAAALPLAILAPYFAAIAMWLPVTWSVHLITGAVTLSVAIGGLLGLLATPSASRAS